MEGPMNPKAYLLIAVATAALLTPAKAQIEPRAGTWKTWVLQSGSELRLPAPPDPNATAGELGWLRAFMSQADATARNQVAFWDTGAPATRWIEILSNRVMDGRTSVPESVRAYRLLTFAI